jgi:hypothetical protein
MPRAFSLFAADAMLAHAVSAAGRANLDTLGELGVAFATRNDHDWSCGCSLALLVWGRFLSGAARCFVWGEVERARHQSRRRRRCRLIYASLFLRFAASAARRLCGCGSLARGRQPLCLGTCADAFLGLSGRYRARRCNAFTSPVMRGFARGR